MGFPESLIVTTVLIFLSFSLSDFELLEAEQQLKVLMLKSARPLTDQILLPTFVLSIVARPLELESFPFFSINLRSLKRIRDAGGFAGVNPPMPKLVQGVYGKTM
ncbi:hypothetical protein AB3S75_005737 [Citrus x aurantiifolia]